MTEFTDRFREYFRNLEYYDRGTVLRQDIETVVEFVEEYFDVESFRQFPTRIFPNRVEIYGECDDLVIHVALTNGKVSCFVGKVLTDNVMMEIGHVYDIPTYSWMCWLVDLMEKVS